MRMQYEYQAIPDGEAPQTGDPLFQHVVDTYASETNKVVSTWRRFGDEDLAYRPHPKSSTVLEIMRHQVLSERRFFGEFLGRLEVAAEEVLPQSDTVEAFS